MEKIDFRKTYKTLFTASDKKVSFVNIPELNYLTIEGKGHPEGNPEFEQKIGAIYGMAYTLKFMFKDKSKQPKGYYDFVIPPFGARWSSPGMEFTMENKDEWRWELTIMMADFITAEHLEMAKSELKKKKDPSAWLDELKLTKIHEGETATFLHIGPYDEVGNTYNKIFEAVKASGRELVCGKCHEIYLNDPRRNAPEKLKTLVRVELK